MIQTAHQWISGFYTKMVEDCKTLNDLIAARYYGYLIISDFYAVFDI